MDYILGGHTSKLEVMDVGVNKPLNSYVREAYENFMIGNPENRKASRGEGGRGGRELLSGSRLGRKNWW